jgi:septal ring factor EnvC (AmiA/AmiB activator)
MSADIMQAEDIIAMQRAELGAQREQIDNLVAVVVARDKRIAELEEERAVIEAQRDRMTEVLDDVCGIQRRREEAARQDIARQQEEAGL